VTRAERLRRVFPAYYAVSLTLMLGSVQVAKEQHTSAAVAVPVTISPSAVMVRPPKPEVVRAATPGLGTGGDSGYTLERCAGMSGDFADACYAAVARDKAPRDPEGGLAACTKIGPEELRFECIADVAEGHAVVEVAWSRATCETIRSNKWRDQCVFGIASAFALVDPQFALTTCEDTRQYKPFCRHDVNGERSTVDPEGAMAYCRALPVENQTTCWHGLGKYIGRKDEAEAASVCTKVPTNDDFRGQCYHGLGWAMAEKDGAAAADRCEGLGEGRDSCMLGVAYQQRPYDPESAARLCDRANSPGERAHCLDFVAGSH
jgi:hypothetical protein